MPEDYLTKPRVKLPGFAFVLTSAHLDFQFLKVHNNNEISGVLTKAKGYRVLMSFLARDDFFGPWGNFLSMYRCVHGSSAISSSFTCSDNRNGYVGRRPDKFSWIKIAPRLVIAPWCPDILESDKSDLKKLIYINYIFQYVSVPFEQFWICVKCVR